MHWWNKTKTNSENTERVLSDIFHVQMHALQLVWYNTVQCTYNVTHHHFSWQRRQLLWWRRRQRQQLQQITNDDDYDELYLFLSHFLQEFTLKLEKRHSIITVMLFSLSLSLSILFLLFDFYSKILFTFFISYTRCMLGIFLYVCLHAS